MYSMYAKSLFKSFRYTNNFIYGVSDEIPENSLDEKNQNTNRWYDYVT